ncbi:hypothetical protein HQ560_11350, partial [bacterium]|nr:hypothetical protein [bacterium]
MGDDNRHGQPKGDGDGPQGIRRSRGLIIWFLLIGGVILIVSLGDQSGDGRDGEDKVSYTDVVQAIGDGKVKSIRVANATMHVTPREGAPDGKFPNKEFKITISPEVIRTVEQIVREHNIAAETASTEKVDIEFDEPSALLQHLLGMAPW